MRHYHEPAGLNDFDDPATWDAASYSAHPVDSIEPLPDAPNDYRAAAIFHMRLMYVVDEFITAAPDARVAVVAVAVVLGWPSARGLSVGNIADQLGCSLSTLTRSIARFKTMAGLNSAGGVRFIRPGAGSSNDDKPGGGSSVGSDGCKLNFHLGGNLSDALPRRRLNETFPQLWKRSREKGKGTRN